MRKTLTRCAMLLLGLLIAAAGAWGVLAILFAGPADALLRNSLAGVFAVVTLAALIALVVRRWRGRTLVTYLIQFIALLFCWYRLEPSNERDWQADVAVLPYASIDGDLVTMHNIRNFDYRSETDYTPAWYDKTFDLRKLRGVDLIASYWMGPAIAHVFLSFDFGDDEHLAISIETRKEKGEAYSTLKGFFRQYELFYVVADERDVIRLRTNYRRSPAEEVYLYPLHAPIEHGRQLFLEYIQRINTLKDHPEFYNSLTTNCTTAMWLHSRVNPQHLPFDWRIIASGYVPQLLYQHDLINSAGLPFAEVRRQAHINARAQAANDAVDFSRLIRMDDPAQPVEPAAQPPAAPGTRSE
ncbi:MAG: DUF4105 domain-containing protein [Pseudomonas sp.]|jgi:hypothetical protein|uniref:Lnb N-terminal periplasmic domain-containing protein n=1 Tax=Pseudomonas sp. TaxID=306 RepID=UPI0027278252|nr:DUF4105 domain-containing protein [Pseudomonas sp.]MDO9616174.1 DUF4105 domain-containing protein [Pseudomonas sp.]